MGVPKQKVKMWQWVYECGSQYSLDVDFHKSLADAIVALEDGYGFKVIQKADWTEIEVEVEVIGNIYENPELLETDT